LRLWHLVFGILVLAMALTIARDPAGRVAVIVFFVGLAEVILGTSALLVLFQAVGAIGEADRPFAYAGAVVTATLVLAASTAIMAGLIFAGAWLVSVTLD
jgi:hypothetical protein